MLLSPDKEIIQNGDHMIIKTLSTFRNYNVEFDLGKEFFEDLAAVDGRKCMVSIRTHLFTNPSRQLLTHVRHVLSLTV